ncbi:hypothetical protein ACH5RR_022730 [Cinchona calisaya]|uniref:HMA domain-containing protein n=1 Tax=Cinchona calisaya TaxID=153742 RepID=A0ABD2Z9N9_9GENT
MKKTELKVSISCQKCKTELIKAVSKLEGIDEITVNAEKGILTVVGEVDPVHLTNKVRKTGKQAEIISVGPPKKPDPPNKPDTGQKPLPPCCPNCQFVVVSSYYDPYDSRICTIL